MDAKSGIASFQADSSGPPTVLADSAWVHHLERAHAGAHKAARAIHEQLEPNVHLAPAARWLERGLGALYDAFDRRDDVPTAISVARVRLWQAAILVARGGLPAALAALYEACRELTLAERCCPPGIPVR